MSRDFTTPSDPLRISIWGSHAWNYCSVDGGVLAVLAVLAVWAELPEVASGAGEVVRERPELLLGWLSVMPGVLRLLGTSTSSPGSCVREGWASGARVSGACGDRGDWDDELWSLWVLRRLSWLSAEA